MGTHRGGCHGSFDEEAPNGVFCINCDGLLTGRQKKYCSAACSKRAGRAAWVLKVYGITLEEYDQILEFQGGGCAICSKVPTEGKPLHIDHEHGGSVRGLLCAYCNTRLVGRLKEHGKAQRLADYLREPPAHRALGRVVVAPGRPPRKRQPRKRKR